MNRPGGLFTPSTLVLIASALAFSLGGCGFKDRPIPPREITPRAIEDLRVDLDEQGATLAWTYPKETVTGRNVSAVERFEIYRAEIPLASYCKTCPIPYDRPIEVPGGALVPDSAKAATFEARGLRPGNLYFFKVRSVTGWWSHSEDSNQISFLWQTPPQTPEGLAVTPGDAKLELRWSRVTQGRDAAPLGAPVQYQLYRGVDGGALAKKGIPLTQASFTDAEVENGRKYTYQVQALTAYEQGIVTSGLSGAVSAMPVDRTPPPVPARVAGIVTEMGIKVYWDQVEAPDLAGYKVYRRIQGEAKPTFVGEIYPPYSIFVDAQAPHKTTIHYSVTSFDTWKPANESAPSTEVRVDN